MFLNLLSLSTDRPFTLKLLSAALAAQVLLLVLEEPDCTNMWIDSPLSFRYPFASDTVSRASEFVDLT